MSLVTCPNATGQQHIAPVLVEVVEKNEIISVFLILLAHDLVQIVESYESVNVVSVGNELHKPMLEHQILLGLDLLEHQILLYITL